MVDVTPAIFPADAVALQQQVAELAPQSAWIQIDMSDGTMVPLPTVMDMGVFGSAIAACPRTSFEAHLMVDNPVKYLKNLADAGFKRVIAHVEASNPRHFLDEARLESVEVGMALDGASEVEAIEPFLDTVDFVVVMTIEAGVADGPFLPEALEKIRSLRHHFPDLAIAAEGGIGQRNAALAVQTGATRLIVSSALFAQTLRALSVR